MDFVEIHARGVTDAKLTQSKTLPKIEAEQYLLTWLKVKFLGINAHLFYREDLKVGKVCQPRGSTIQKSKNL